LSCLGIIEELDLNKIFHPPIQLRIKLDNLDELACSIREHGLLQPIIVRPIEKRYELVAGNRRYQAVRKLGLRKINCHLIDLSDQEAYELALTENVQHKTMNPIEEAVAFNRYVKEFGWGGVSNLALKIGRSQEYVTKRIQLLSLPKNVIIDIISNRISTTTALELLPLNNSQIQALSKIIHNSHLSKNQVRHIIKNSKNIRNNKHSDTAYCDLISQQDMEKAFRRAITVLKSTLISWDDIIRNMNDDWLLRELFLEYRVALHGDIDTFLRLRKRMKRINNIHIENSESLSGALKHKRVDRDNDSTIPVWTPRTY
jgi:ParB family transcriptional regulator, chromosome partitioning protein